MSRPGVNDVVELVDGRAAVVWAWPDEEDEHEEPGVYVVAGDEPAEAADAYVGGAVDVEWMPLEAIR